MTKSSSPVLTSLCRARLAELRRTRNREKLQETVSPSALELLDFIPTITPRWERPDHLAAIAELFARAEREEVQALISVPPQHGKTETILHGIAWILSRHPDWPILYASYAADLAQSKSRLARDYTRAAGVLLRDDSKSVSEWMTTDGGGLIARGVGGGATGYPVKLLVIDDPFKNREEAESALRRDRVFDWYTSSARTRVHPGGSKIICHTRWHEDDLIGRLAKEGGWEVINLPAISDDGQPLWDKRPLDFLAKCRAASEYDWWSLYMGSPRPRGGAVFRGVSYYKQLPQRFRIGKGLDLAYSAKTHADYSVGVVVLESEGLFYVVAVSRAQCEVPKFVPELRMLDARYPGAWRWYCNSTEMSGAQLMPSVGVAIEPMLAKTDKFIRAQPVAAAWNNQKIYVPHGAPWLGTFLDEIGVFSGVGDRHDDQVDAFAAAFDCVAGGGPLIVPSNVPGYRMTGSSRGFG